MAAMKIYQHRLKSKGLDAVKVKGKDDAVFGGHNTD